MQTVQHFTNDHRIYKIIITKDEESGYYVAEVPTLSPCITFGETIDEAVEMAQEAIEAVIETRLGNGFELNDDTATMQNQTKPMEIFMPIGFSSKKMVVA
jgi:antitoxin HicB